jgi:hypothetical protein
VYIIHSLFYYAGCPGTGTYIASAISDQSGRLRYLSLSYILSVVLQKVCDAAKKGAKAGGVDSLFYASSIVKGLKSKCDVSLIVDKFVAPV